MFENKTEKVVIEDMMITEQSCICDICKKQLVHAIKGKEELFIIDMVSPTDFVIAETDYSVYNMIPRPTSEPLTICENCISSYIMKAVKKTNVPIKIRYNRIVSGETFYGTLYSHILAHPISVPV